MRYSRAIFMAVLESLLLLAACAEHPLRKDASDEVPESVGNARMLQNGTLQLFLIGKSGRAIAESFIELKPNDEKYEKYIAHIGGIKPGELKSIPPWKDGER